ncbi:MAG TPA: fasciclin domain-containing protein, partial [Puia sp.]|nr:fasciclin domain-containing protein [Puia sp.]
SYGYATVNDVTNANADSLAKILLYHMIPSRLFTCDISLGQHSQTAQGGSVLFTATGTQRQIRGTNNDSNADLLKADVMARNGVLYVINQVLVP